MDAGGLAIRVGNINPGSLASLVVAVWRSATKAGVCGGACRFAKPCLSEAA